MKSLLTSFLCLIAVSLLWAVSSCEPRGKQNCDILKEQNEHLSRLYKASMELNIQKEKQWKEMYETLTHKNLTIERLKQSSQDLKYEIELRDKEIERLKHQKP